MHLPPPALLKRKIIIKNKKKHHKKTHNSSTTSVTTGNGEVLFHAPVRQGSKDSNPDDDDNGVFVKS